MGVLNLIITGMPSIPKEVKLNGDFYGGFKPYYNWNAFNTFILCAVIVARAIVLNLIITGMPSIQGSTNPLRKYLK